MPWLFDKMIRQELKESKPRPTASSYPETHFIHSFKVSLKDNPDIWRIIEIKENQMLSSLHKAIFKAFDRFEEHQYSFFLSGKPYDKESEYVSPDLDTNGMSKLASRTRIDSIPLYGGPKFLYLFDYGDEWWHDVELIGVTKRTTRAKYPRVVKNQSKHLSRRSGALLYPTCLRQIDLREKAQTNRRSRICFVKLMKLTAKSQIIILLVGLLSRDCRMEVINIEINRSNYPVPDSRATF